MDESAEDPYQVLLSGTRALHREQRALRESWLDELSLDAKDELLFEFEVLLKAAACFSNPRNHPGPQRRSLIVTQDFRLPLQTFHDGLERAIELARQLLGPLDRRFVFHRYLETVLPEDDARVRLLSSGTPQSSPAESLIALRHGLTSSKELLEGMLKAPRVSFRSFHALLGSTCREVDRSAFFNPLSALEFRPEFDRIKSAKVLDLIRNVTGSEARRLVALTFLSLFRMLRYLSLLGRIGNNVERRRQRAGSTYLVLSVLRSDARALSDHLLQSSGVLLARGYERDVLLLSASQVRARSASLRAGGHRLLAVRSALHGIAGSLRLEMRRAFQHELPAPEQSLRASERRERIEACAGELRTAMQNAVLFLGKALGVNLDDEGVFDERAARRATSERLRRDVWIFGQIVRAFASKARHSLSEDRWSAVNDFQYVREFLSYFRSLGYPLLRSSDYPRFDAFIEAMSRLEDTDLVDPARLAAAIDECTAFHGFLQDLFEAICRRDELAGLAFDRRAAASSLRLYLGE